MPAPKITRAQLLEVMELRITQTEAAARLGVTQPTIRMRLRAEGLTWPEPAGKVDRETFTRLWNCHGIKTEEIAAALGTSRQAVSDRARRMGLPSRAGVVKKLIRDDEFRDMWLAGVRAREIAEYFGLADKACASTAAGALGLPRREKAGGGLYGWTHSISMREYQERKLGQLMAAEAQKRAK